MTESGHQDHTPPRRGARRLPSGAALCAGPPLLIPTLGMSDKMLSAANFSCSYIASITTNYA